MQTVDELVLGHLWLCDLHAKTVFLRIKQRIPLDDLIQYARIGLIKAAQRFDGARGFKFKSYADRKVRGYIIDGIRTETRFQRGKGKLQPQLVSLGAVDGEGREYAAQPAAPDLWPAVNARIDTERLERANLTERELRVARLTHEGYSLKEIAYEIGCSWPTVAQLRTSALKALKAAA